jgi:hypothetical protein
MSADLVATGLTLVGGYSSGDLVVDGTGMAWADGAWAVERIDPVTGTATVWDASDDAAFASVQHLAAGQPSGVWLIEAGTARLFDGERFAATLALPDEYRRDDDPGSTVADLLQVGEQVLVAGKAGVARWSAGTWTPIGADRLVAAGHLAVDTAGAVWAGGTLVDGAGGGRTNAVVRLDGGTWTGPGVEDGAPSGEVGDVAADPRGGVWATSMAEGTVDHGVFRFDGTQWRKAGDGGYAHDLGVTTTGEVWAMVSDGDGRSAPGIFTACRLGPDGSWQSFDGPPLTDEGSSADLAVSGDRVLLVHEEGLVGLSGERFEPIWANPAAVVGTAFGVGPGRLIAVGADELWMPTVYPTGPDGIVPGTGLGHYVAGTWRTVDVPMCGDTQIAPVLASDGAVWHAGTDGLYRVVGEHATLIADHPRCHEYDAGLGAGPDGSVFAAAEGSVVRVDPDGTTTRIGSPEPGDLLSPDLAFAEGVLWASGIRGAVSRWDGAWSTVPLPRPYTWAHQLVVARGALIAVLTDDRNRQALGRYADAAWTVEPRPIHAPAVGPDGLVHALDADGTHVLRLDEALAVTSSTPIGAAATSLAIGADGATWVVGEQVARLPGRDHPS